MELLERGLHLAEFQRLLDGLPEDQGRLVFLGGEAGVGKTALVDALCGTVRPPVRVLRGGCDPLSTPRPLGPLVDIAGGLGDAVPPLLAEHQPRAFAFRAVLDGLAGRDPALVIFEDVHWADEATLDLLRYLGRRIGPTRALLIATYRDDEVGSNHPLRVVLGDLATAPAIGRRSLAPLSLESVRELAAGSDLDPVRLHRQTAGNPFFVTEVLAAGEIGIPPTVRDAVMAR
ncbi:MAG TPA: AAA family ATPase, partial [Thermomicrobiales bacterium]|nr:AAA family ATPase [Thermomicrobiales bacterium]